MTPLGAQFRRAGTKRPPKTGQPPPSCNEFAVSCDLIFVIGPIFGAGHRPENRGKIDLELIDVQTGSYLGKLEASRLRQRVSFGKLRRRHRALAHQISAKNSEDRRN